MLYFVRKNLRLFLKENCRPFYCIWYGRRKETWRKTRCISSAIMGAFCAYLLCKLMFASFVFPRKHERFVLSLVMALISCGFVFTDSVKCVVFLIFVALMGKSGRGYLRALCFAFVIAGPIENLSSNAGEIVRVYTCSKMLTLNLTRTRFDLMTKPFQNTLQHMKDDIKEVQDTFNELHDVTKAIHQEVLEDDPPLTYEDLEQQLLVNQTNGYMETNHTTLITKRQNDNSSHEYTPEYIEQSYKNKFRKRCRLQLDHGKERCRKAFANSLEKCREKMPFMLKTLICWPFKIDFVCKMNILGNPDKICDPSEAIPEDFGQTYIDLVHAEDRLYQGNSDDVKVHYAIARPEEMPEFQSAKETAKSVAKEFSVRKQIFDSILKILEQCLAFMLFKVLIDYVHMEIKIFSEKINGVLKNSITYKLIPPFKRINQVKLKTVDVILFKPQACISYHKHYNNSIDHDNIYISEYFKRIDQERQSRGKNSLLPLKKFEKRNLIDVANVWQRSVEESRAVTFHLLQFALEIVAALFFLFLDYAIVSVLLVIRKNSEMSFVQEGEHTLHFSIQGSGLIARLLRTTLHNFNMHETVSTYMTNEPCLPKPTTLPRSFYLKLVGLYILVIFLIYQSATFLRMRRLICGYFYRKREKRRIIYLYNCLLRQRRSATEAMLKQAKYNFANRKIRLKANIFLKLRLRWPQYFNWLIRFKAGRRKCVICDGLEDETFVICKSPECGVSYCDDCWQDMGNECLVCNEIVSVAVILNFNDFFEEFSFV